MDVPGNLVERASGLLCRHVPFEERRHECRRGRPEARSTFHLILCFLFLVTAVSAQPFTYRLRPGDVIGVQYRYTPEYNQDATVQPDGFVSLQLFGQVKAAGLTVDEARTEFQKLAATRLRDPEIAVVLKDFEKPAFFVLGEVNTPGRFEMRGVLSVTQAIAMGGGFKNTAKHSQVILLRNAGEGMAETRLLNVKSMLQGSGRREQFLMRSGDVLVVPQNRVSQIERYLRWGTFGIYVPLFGR